MGDAANGGIHGNASLPRMPRASTERPPHMGDGSIEWDKVAIGAGAHGQSREDSTPPCADTVHGPERSRSLRYGPWGLPRDKDGSGVIVLGIGVEELSLVIIFPFLLPSLWQKP